MRGFRGQLNLLVAVTMSLVLVAFLVPLGLLLRRDAEQRAISTATLRAQSIAAVLALSPDSAIAPTDATGTEATVYHAPATAAWPPAVALAAQGQAFAARASGGVDVVVPVQSANRDTAVVRVFVPDRVLHAGVARTWSLLGLLGLLLLVLGLLLADRLARRLVDPVAELASTADGLAGGDLTRRIRPRGTTEIRSVGRGLNRLADRIGHLLAAEREDAANLAHRLRTPITALRLDVESVADGPDRDRLTADVDALNRAVDEVIRTARRSIRDGGPTTSDAATVARERVAFWAVLAEDTDRTITISVPDRPVPVPLPAADLAAALDALLENVFSHTPDGVSVAVTLTVGPAGARLAVVDHGPGFTASPERGVSGAGSTGLGLDIVRRTAEAAGGTLQVGPGPAGGAAVELVLPIDG